MKGLFNYTGNEGVKSAAEGRGKAGIRKGKRTSVATPKARGERVATSSKDGEGRQT